MVWKILLFINEIKANEKKKYISITNDFNFSKLLENYIKDSNNTQLPQNENNKNTEKSNSDIIKKDTNKKFYMTRPITGEEKKFHNLIPPTKRNDRWMPKNFQKYDLQVKNPQILNKKIEQEEKLRRVPSFSYSEIRKKMKDSDIFSFN